MTKYKFADKMKKSTMVLAAAVLMAAMTVQPVMAAATISSVSVKLNLDLEEGEDLPTLEIGYTGTASSDTLEVMIPQNNKYDIVDAEWSKEVDEAELGKTYKLKVTLDAESDYSFKSSYASSKVTVKGGTFVSARRNDAGQLVVTLKTKEVEGILAEPDDLRWLSENFKNEKFGYAKWDGITNAAYQIQLLRNEKVVHRVSEWNSTSYNFYPYMTKEGDYQFRVRSIPKNEDVKAYATGSEWTYSDEMYVAKDEVSDGSGQGQQVDTADTANSTNNAASGIVQVGWIKNGDKWYFRYPDGSYLRDSWGKIDEKWYLFNSTGAMLTGWQNVNNVWYYLNPSGDMLTGWLWDNQAWYYLNPDGSMKTGWLVDNGKTYYLDQSGVMLTGWQEIGGLYYYFYADGHKAVNETISGFYVDYNGVWQRP